MRLKSVMSGSRQMTSELLQGRTRLARRIAAIIKAVASVLCRVVSELRKLARSLPPLLPLTTRHLRLPSYAYRPQEEGAGYSLRTTQYFTTQSTADPTRIGKNTPPQLYGY